MFAQNIIELDKTSSFKRMNALVDGIIGKFLHHSLSNIVLEYNPPIENALTTIMQVDQFFDFNGEILTYWERCDEFTIISNQRTFSKNFQPYELLQLIMKSKESFYVELKLQLQKILQDNQYLFSPYSKILNG